MASNERGIALVTVLLLLVVLMIMALVLSDKVVRATRDVTLAGARDQALQAAGAGIEWARDQLATNYRASSGWATYLAGSPDGERYPEHPAFRIDIGRVPVDIFLRDNPDGDNDPHHDNDLKLFVLACARPEPGPRTLVESLCGLDPAGAGYRQAGETARRGGQAVDGPAEPWSAPVTSFHLEH